MDSRKLQHDIQKKSHARLSNIYKRYHLNPDSLESVIKWKSVVLVLGNYSSGKSTLINEFFETDIQRTGQSPTDDSFTIITAPDKGSSPQEIPGSTLVGDDRLPFTSFKKYGEQFTSHFLMKQVDSPQLENLAIIDSPGMLDAITEKDRGYDYSGVIGALARLADLVILMFDPHKAGTVREAYETIRNTLPGKSGEDRLLFVMSRIDECDNPGDLVRSYGTLCWNLSQMTGRKDIPRIFLTYSPAISRNPEIVTAWHNERDEIKAKILNAPALRINHILQHVDRQAHELRVLAESLAMFSQRGRKLLNKTGRNAFLFGTFIFFFLDIICREFTGIPDSTLIASLLSGSTTFTHLLIPVIGATTTFLLIGLMFTKIQLPRLKKQAAANPDKLVDQNSDYNQQLWQKMRVHAQELIREAGIKEIMFFSHQKILSQIDRFINKDLQGYFKSGTNV